MQIFLKLTGVKTGPMPGGATDRQHKGQIVIDSFSWGLHTPVDATSGQPTGRPIVSTLDFVAATGLDSPRLVLASLQNEPVTGDLRVVTTNSRGVDSTSTQITFSGGVIVAYRVGGSSANASPHDGFSITFAKMEYKEYPGPVVALVEPGQVLG